MAAHVTFPLLSLNEICKEYNALGVPITKKDVAIPKVAFLLQLYPRIFGKLLNINVSDVIEKKIGVDRDDQSAEEWMKLMLTLVISERVAGFVRFHHLNLLHFIKPNADKVMRFLSALLHFIRFLDEADVHFNGIFNSKKQVRDDILSLGEEKSTLTAKYDKIMSERTQIKSQEEKYAKLIVDEEKKGEDLLEQNKILKKKFLKDKSEVMKTKDIMDQLKEQKKWLLLKKKKQKLLQKKRDEQNHIKQLIGDETEVNRKLRRADTSNDKRLHTMRSDEIFIQQAKQNSGELVQLSEKLKTFKEDIQVYNYELKKLKQKTNDVIFNSDTVMKREKKESEVLMETKMNKDSKINVMNKKISELKASLKVLYEENQVLHKETKDLDKMHKTEIKKFMKKFKVLIVNINHKRADDQVK